jgi:diguanylate cyclase (GGDEF)-like protein
MNTIRAFGGCRRELSVLPEGSGSTSSQRELELKARNRRLQLKVERLTRLVYLDSLTGLANRRYFETALDLEIRRACRNGSSLTLLLCDVDHFKRFNDAFGHQHGDFVLARVARLAASYCRRAGDVAARYGGEEFALLFPAATWYETSALAERLRGSVAALRIKAAQAPGLGPVTISIGATTFHSAEPRSATEIVRAADAALYDAKREGRNRIKYRATAIGRSGSPSFGPRLSLSG